MSGKTEFSYFNKWFDDYEKRFDGGGGEVSAMMRMKSEHSLRVAENCRVVATEAGLGPAAVEEAAITGLFHDIGRFRQLAEYGTFSDRKSVNHAELGAAILSSEPVLDTFDREVKQRIIDAIRLHNVLVLPNGLPEETMLHAKIIRDADKLDICDILFHAWKRKELEKYPEIMFGISLDGPVSPEAESQIRNKQVISFANLRTLSDFFLTQLSWIYDINLAPTFRLIMERGLISNIAEALDGQDNISDVLREAEEYVAKKRYGEN